MNKVILTQEQADAVKKLKESIKANHEKFRDNHQCNLADWEYVLLDIPTEKYLNAIFEGYEVAPTFKIGDWATHKLTGDVGVIKLVNSESIRCENGMGGWINDFRHAIPEEIAEEKERRFFAKHGRKPWELRTNDVLVNNANKKDIFSMVSVNKEKGKYYDSTHTYYTLEDLKNSYKVLCFAEQRLDVKEDE